MDADIDQKLTDIFAEMARSYDEANIWKQRKRVLALVQQEIAKAQVGELKSLQDCKNVAGEKLVNMGTDVWIADRIAELSQTLKK